MNLADTGLLDQARGQESLLDQIHALKAQGHPEEARAILKRQFDDSKLRARIDEVRIDAHARAIVKRETAAEQLRLPPERDDYTLASYAAEVRPPRIERIERLQRAGHMGLLAAAFKVGKTTLVANLGKALADRTPFLADFAVTAPRGRVGFWNVEMDAEDYEDYLTDTGIENDDGVAIWNLRGYSVDLMSEPGRDAAVEWLRDNDVSYWVIDPWQRVCAWSGVDENKNAEVGPLLQRVQEVADDAGVDEILIVHHMGHDGHIRGATVLPGTADVIWHYSRDDEGLRWLNAEGRGVRLSGQVELRDGVTRFMATTPAAARLELNIRRVVDYVRENPDRPATAPHIALPIASAEKKNVVHTAIARGLVAATKVNNQKTTLRVDEPAI